MARPYKRRGSPFYWGDIWFGGKKKSISLKTGNHGVARAKFNQLQASADEVGLKLPTKTPIGEATENFAAHLAISGRPKSARTDLYRLREFFGPVCLSMDVDYMVRHGRQCTPSQARSARSRKAKPPKAYEFAVRVHFVEQVTTAMVSNFLTTIRNARRLESKTVNEYREILHRLFAWAIEQQGVRMPGDAKANPVAGVKRMKTSEPSIRFLQTIDDIRKQLKALESSPRIQTMVAVLIYAGLRRSEMLLLTPADVDLPNRRIYVRRKQVAGTTYDTKTGRKRFVPISHTLLPHLIRYRPPIHSLWFFPSPQGAKWDADNFSHRLATINHQAGLDWNCLEFRHTFGSHLAMKGVSLYKISELMGNSPEICRRHYVCLLPESLVECVEFDTSRSGQQVPAAHAAIGCVDGPQGA